MVAMESGCHPTPPLLGRRLVARHYLLGHLGSQRACLGLSEGAGSLGPSRHWNLGGLFSGSKKPEQPVAGVCHASASSFGASAFSPVDPGGPEHGSSLHFTDGDR